MFNLEKAISQWRAGLVRDHGLTEEVIIELESHLRDSFDDLSRTMDLEDAFRGSVEALGQPMDLAKEFRKDGPVTRVDWAIILVIVGFSFISLFTSLNTFFKFNGGVDEIIKWYFVVQAAGNHIAHVVGGLGVYYLLRYVAHEKEEASFNQLFTKSLRVLTPFASLFIWAGVAIYILGNGPLFPFHSVYNVLMVAAPLALLPLCWMKLARIHLAQCTIVLWAVIITATNLKDHHDNFLAVMLFVLGLMGLIVALPLLDRFKQKITPA